MKLAFVSYEFPPDTAVGGIATYVHQTSKAMRKRGHEVEVFCASPSRESLNERFEDDVIVHRIRNDNLDSFRRDVVKQFAVRHASVGFDLVESPEYGAEGLLIKRQFPDLPMIVKCHTPGYFVKRLNRALRADSWKERARRALGIKQYHKQHDRGYQLALLAERISSPSFSLGDHLAVDWGIQRNRIDDVPYVFVPQREVLEISPATNFRVVTFLGRLEVRKGVVALGHAIPLVLRRHPDAVFRFIGRSCRGPSGKRSMVEFLNGTLAAHLSNIEFIDHVPLDQVPAYLAQTDICVYPSLWENFPYVCLEAMSAARGIVASREGGMKDMLEDIDGGMLIDPRDPRDLAEGIIALLDHPQQRQAMGMRCRQKIVQHYAHAMIGITEDYYAATIAAA